MGFDYILILNYLAVIVSTKKVMTSCGVCILGDCNYSWDIFSPEQVRLSSCYLFTTINMLEGGDRDEVTVLREIFTFLLFLTEENGSYQELF